MTLDAVDNKDKNNKKKQNISIQNNYIKPESNKQNLTRTYSVKTQLQILYLDK